MGYNVRIVQENTGRTIYEIKNLVLDDEHITLVAHGTTDDNDEFPYAITKLVDDNDPGNGDARLRMYHTAAGVPTINVTVAGDTIYDDVSYTELTNYESISPGTRTVSIIDSRTGDVLIPLTNLPFDDLTIVNLYFAGAQGVSTDRLTVIVAIDIEDEPESSNSA